MSQPLIKVGGVTIAASSVEELRKRPSKKKKILTGRVKKANKNPVFTSNSFGSLEVNMTDDESDESMA